MRNTFRVFALVLILGFAGRVYAQVADPAPTPVLAYVGRLIESNKLATGSRPFVFSILDSGGDVLWTSGPQTLTVTDGLYGIVLGAAGMPALPASLTLKADLHLRVIADGVQLSPDVPLEPAFQASVAWSVIGPFLGDISGTQQTISVNRLQGTPLDLTAAPSSGEVLMFNGTSWIASPASAGAGSRGPAGPEGPQGVPGPTGIAGPAGPQGPPGAPGSQGAAGDDGLSVLNGAVDPAPTVGVNGDFYINTATSNIFGPKFAGNWPAGISLIGPTGTQGPNGPAGATGVPGSPGPQGVQGFAGPVGAQGPAGAAGTNGSGFDFRNAFDPSANYAIDDVVTYNGSTYVAIAASNGPSNPTPDMNATDWSVLAQEGAAGTAGAPGPAGAAGAAGAMGLQGAAGPAGPQGVTGAAGTNGSGFDFRNAFDPSANYAIDDVVTYNGSTYVAIAASNGPSNPTPAMNATDWSVLAQEGAAGTAGAPGSPGAPGVAGSQGAAGAAGSAGPAGAPGSAGAPGATGSQGPTGAAGAPGRSGP